MSVSLGPVFCPVSLGVCSRPRWRLMCVMCYSLLCMCPPYFRRCAVPPTRKRFARVGLPTRGGWLSHLHYTSGIVVSWSLAQGPHTLSQCCAHPPHAPTRLLSPPPRCWRTAHPVSRSYGFEVGLPGAPSVAEPTPHTKRLMNQKQIRTTAPYHNPLVTLAAHRPAFNTPLFHHFTSGQPIQKRRSPLHPRRPGRATRPAVARTGCTVHPTVVCCRPVPPPASRY